MSDAVQKLTALKHKVEQINLRIAKADALRQQATRNLEAARLEADLEFGTSDPATLEKMAEDARIEAEALVASTEQQLEATETLLAAAEKALQS